MKKIIYILLLTVLFNACRKNLPEPDRIGYGAPSYYTNKYILKNINANNFKEDTIWKDNYYYTIESYKVEDTVKYSDLYIKIDLTGLLISENIYFTNLTTIEQKYFINKIKDFKIHANNINITSKVIVLKKGKNTDYVISNIINEELGYTPLKIELTDTLNTSGKIIFKIVFTDDNNNIFETKTDSIFILNN